MAAHGGARPGAGRKPKIDKYSEQVVAAENRIADRLPALIDNMIALADGVTVQEATPQGGTRTYTRAPDYKANEYLINRIMGKPTERVEHTGDDGGPIDARVTTIDRATEEVTRWRQLMTERLLALTAPGEAPAAPTTPPTGTPSST